MTFEEIKEKYARDESGYIWCQDCPLCIKKCGVPRNCLGYNDYCNGYEKAYERIQKYLSDKENLSDKKNTVVLYIDWKKKDIISEQEYNKTADISTEKYYEWLDFNYSASDIYEMDGIERQDAYNKFCEAAKKDSKKIRSDYERVEVEL